MSNLLDEVNAILRDSLTPDGIEQWWNARNRYLHGRRPVDEIETDPAIVFEAAHAFAEGAYL